MGSEPGLPEMPEPVEHSDTEVMLRWRIPQDNGHAPILAYGLQMKSTCEWTGVGVEWGDARKGAWEREVLFY